MDNIINFLKKKLRDISQDDRGFIQHGKFTLQPITQPISQAISNIKGNIQAIANPQTRATWFQGFTPSSVSIPLPQTIKSPVPIPQPRLDIGQAFNRLKTNVGLLVNPQTRKVFLKGFQPETPRPISNLVQNLKLIQRSPQFAESIPSAIEEKAIELGKRVGGEFGHPMAGELLGRTVGGLERGFTRALTTPFTRKPTMGKLADVVSGIGSTIGAGESVVMGGINPIFTTIGTLITKQRLPTKDELMQSYSEGIKFGTEFGPVSKIASPITESLFGKLNPKTVKTAIDVAKRLTYKGLSGGTAFGAYGYLTAPEGKRKQAVIDNAIQGALMDMGMEATGLAGKKLIGEIKGVWSSLMKLPPKERAGVIREFTEERIGLQVKPKGGTKAILEAEAKKGIPEMRLSKEAQELMEKAKSHFPFGKFSPTEVIETAKKIAKLDRNSIVEPAHIAEALQYNGSYNQWLKNTIEELAPQVSGKFTIADYERIIKRYNPTEGNIGARIQEVFGKNPLPDIEKAIRLLKEKKIETLTPKRYEQAIRSVQKAVIQEKPKIKIKLSQTTPPLSPTGEIGGGGEGGFKPSQAPPTSNDDLIKRLTEVIKKAKPIRGKQEALYTQARGEKLARLIKIREKMAGEKGFFEELGALKGELPKIQFESIRQEFNQDSVDRLFNMIKEHPHLNEWEKVNAQVGLAKILGKKGGGVPTRGELEKLYTVFGKDFTEALLEKRPLFEKLTEAGMQLYNLPRTMMAGIDLSATLLQNVMFAFRHPITTAKNLGEEIKFFINEGYFNQAMEEIAKRPTFNAMKEAKLALTKMGPIISEREEAFMSSWAEKIPGLGRLYKAGGRAYTGFLNKMRADVFDQLYYSAKEVGVDVENPEFLKSLGEFINNATGRGNLGKFERLAPVLSQGLFSARKLAATVNMIRPDIYIKMHPFIRKEALKTWLAYLGGGMTILGLAKLAGANVGDDPTSADFGKIKIGNTRFNIWGTYQQLARLPIQIIKGYVTSSTSGQRIMLGEGYKPLTPLDILSRFFEMKEHPTLSLIKGAIARQTNLGEPFQWGPEVIDKFIPMLISDAYDLYQEHGAKGLLALIPAALGVGVQTYGKKMPIVEKTTTGKEKIKLKFYPRLSDVLWSKLTGKQLTTIPKEQWEGISNVMAKESNAKYLKQQANRLNQLVEEGKMTEDKAKKEMLNIYSSLETKPIEKIEELSPIAIYLGIDKYLGNPPTGAIEKAKWESGRFDAAVKVYKNENIDDQTKESLIQKLGQSPEDITYYDLATSDRSVRRTAVDEVFKKSGIEGLVYLRKSVKEKRILTNTIIDDLVDEGVISYAEGKYLKSVDYVKDKKTGKYTIKTKSGKGKKIKISAPPKIKTIKLNLPTPKKISLPKTMGKKVKVVYKPAKKLPLKLERQNFNILKSAEYKPRKIKVKMRRARIRM